MSPLEDDRHVLEDLGLTESQRNAYLALLRLGSDSKAVTIANFSKVARQDVYRLLIELQHIGIVQKILANPSKFRATPPKEAVEILLKRRRASLSELEKKATKFAQKEVEVLGEVSIPSERDQFIIINDRDALFCKAEEAIGNSQKNFSDITPLKELTPWLTVLSETINKALNRGVKIRWLTEEPQNIDCLSKTLKNLLSTSNFNLRFVPHPPKAKFAIFDNKEMIIALFSEHNFAESPALWSNNAPVVALAENFFESYWNIGIDGKTIMAKLVENEPIEDFIVHPQSSKKLRK